MSTDYFLRRTLRRRACLPTLAEVTIAAEIVRLRVGKLGRDAPPGARILVKFGTPNCVHLSFACAGPVVDSGDWLVVGFTRYGGNDPGFAIEFFQSLGCRIDDEYNVDFAAHKRHVDRALQNHVVERSVKWLPE